MESLSLSPSPKLALQFGDIAENLEILNEECGEVVQMKSKIYRFGMSDHYPGKGGMTNAELLEKEVGDLLAMVEILMSNGVLSAQGLRVAMDQKLAKLPAWYGKKYAGMTSQPN